MTFRYCGTFFVAVFVVLLSGYRPAMTAQSHRPVYVQYDGYVKNADGTYLLAFGYFNMNSIEVATSIGADNSFVPGPADRNQPLTFAPGRRRFACAMVVPANFDGKVQWSVKVAGVDSTTTAKVFDPLYELELNSERQALTGVDPATAPKNVCVNRAPAVNLANPGGRGSGAGPSEPRTLTTVLGQDLSLNAEVSDDGLPRGGRIKSSWRKVSGSGTITFTDANAPTTRVRFSERGNYEVEFSATDGERTTTLRIRVVVNPS